MDCSVTKRKGCNYCLRSKDIIQNSNVFSLNIDDSQNVLVIEYNDENFGIRSENITCINYCPICGKEL